jgi:hypothetical protein
VSAAEYAYQTRTKGAYPPTPPLGLQYDARIQKIAALGGSLEDAFDDIIYDTFRFAGGQNAPTAPLRAFQSAVGATVPVANLTSESYQKSEHDTNMVTPNMLPAGQFFMAESMQALIQFTGATDTTYPTSGAATEEPSVTTALAPISAVNLITALLFQIHLKLRIGDKDYENGPAIYFPSDFGVSGFAGSGNSASVTVNNIVNSETVVNNGFGRSRKFLIEHEIPELRSFYIEMKFLQAIAIPRQFNLRVLLQGVRYRPLQ